MGHCINGIIAPIDVLSRIAAEHNLHKPAVLLDSLGFIPLNPEHLEIMFPEQGEYDESMTYLSQALKSFLVSLSLQDKIAYIETEYFGGVGQQSATVYYSGECILEPQTAESGPVCKALRLLGVARKVSKTDEFDTAGLGRYRSNDDWIKAANLDAITDVTC
jgi:hypothetical protein